MLGGLKNLPVLKAIENAAQKVEIANIDKIGFVCVQHLLNTSVNLFQSLLKIGASPENIFILGKHYSTNFDVVKKMVDFGIQVQSLTKLLKLGEYEDIFQKDVLSLWKNAKRHILENELQGLIVLDDGGRCLELMDKELIRKIPIVGIEQTTAGLFNPSVLSLPVPFIDVATCAAKKYLEADMIAEAVLQKIENILPINSTPEKCGVIGFGVIGQRIAKRLFYLGHQVYVYDIKDEINSLDGIDLLNSIDELFAKADYIFGCSGRDVTENLDFLDKFVGEKFLISCSSEDKEFLSLLKKVNGMIEISTKNPLENISLKLSGTANINIIKGGFPVNFDSSGVSVATENIQLTRGLLLCALLQAFDLIEENKKGRIENGRVMLHPIAQKFTTLTWGMLTNNSNRKIKLFKDDCWVRNNSGGYFVDSKIIQLLSCDESYTDKIVEKDLFLT